MPKTRILAAATALLLAAAPVLAQQSPEMQAMKARQGLMQFYAVNLGVLGGMAKGAVPYDAGAATTAADNIAGVSQLNLSMLWPEGSDDMSLDGSRVLPALWENMADVGAKSAALREAATAMQAAAGTDLAALQAAMGPLGAACGDCHKAYRTPE
jgi:cytochrome c556